MFMQTRRGDFDTKDKDCQGQPTKLEDKEIKTLIHEGNC